jgi:hypothetical protein
MGGTSGGMENLFGLDIPKTPSSGFTKEELEKLKQAPGWAGVAARGDVLPKFPELESDAGAELRRQRALIERTIAAAFTGRGRAATIATSPRGVTTPTPTRRKTLTPAEKTVRRRIAT